MTEVIKQAEFIEQAERANKQVSASRLQGGRQAGSQAGKQVCLQLAVAGCWLKLMASCRRTLMASHHHINETPATASPHFRLQLAALVAESEKKALLAAAARAVVAEAQKAQREGRLLSRDEVAAIK